MGDESSAAILRDIRNELRKLHRLLLTISLAAIGGKVDQGLAKQLDELQPFNVAPIGEASEDLLRQILTEVKRLQELASLTQQRINPEKKSE